MTLFPRTLRVLIADDHEFFRAGVIQMLKENGGFEICGEASNGIELIGLADELKPDLIILDISMPELDGIEALKKLRSSGIHIPTIALSMHNAESFILDMMESGAMSYLEKTVSKSELLSAIESVVLHQTPYFPQTTSNRLLELISEKTYKPFGCVAEDHFSKRELEVIELICQDFSSKQIADQLFISHRTIDTHRSRIMEKMGVRSIAGLVVFAITNRLVDIGKLELSKIRR